VCVCVCGCVYVGMCVGVFAWLYVWCVWCGVCLYVGLCLFTCDLETSIMGRSGPDSGCCTTS